MRSRSFAVLFALSAFAIASPSRADSPAAANAVPASTAPANAAPPPAAFAPGEDEVILKNGGMIRGVVTELEPSKSVTILVQGSGASRTIPWSDVDHVARGIHGGTPAPSAAPAPVPAPAPAPAASASPPSTGDAVINTSDLSPTALGLARIHIATDNPQVQLHRYLGTQTTELHPAGGRGSGSTGTTVVSDLVCRTPCDQVVDGRKGEEFYFGGKDVASSERFQVFDKQGDFVADVHPGSEGERRGGLFSLIGGGGTAILGFAVLGIGLGQSATNLPGNNGDTVAAIGGVAAGVGVAAAIAGVVMLLSSKTTYELHPPRAAASAPPAGPPVPDTEDHCMKATEYDRRAGDAASDEVREQLALMAAHQRRLCVAAGKTP